MLKSGQLMLLWTPYVLLYFDSNERNGSDKGNNTGIQDNETENIKVENEVNDNVCENTSVEQNGDIES